MTSTYSWRRLLSAATSIGLALVLIPLSNAQSPAIPDHEWTQRHPGSGAGAYNDRAVGAGLTGTHTFAVYERRTGPTEATFQILKYDHSGTLVDSLAWPSASPGGQFIPRAMKVFHDSFTNTTRVLVVGDGPVQEGDQRVVYVLALDENLDVLWTFWSKDVSHPRSEEAVALDASHEYVVVVSYDDNKDDSFWCTYIIEATTGVLGFSPFYHFPADPEGVAGQGHDRPVAVSASIGNGEVAVAVVGQLTSATAPESHALALVYVPTDVAWPNPRYVASGVGGVSWYPDNNSYATDVRLLGRRLYMTGYGRVTWPTPQNDYDQFFSIIDLNDPNQASWTHVFSGAAGLDDRPLSLDARGVVAQPQSGLSVSGQSVGAWAWTTGYTSDVNGEPMALTLQFNDKGTIMEPSGFSYIDAQIDWQSIWTGPPGAPRPTKGMQVRAEEQLSYIPDDEIYVSGIALNPTTGMSEVFLMKFTGEIEANKAPYWSEIHASHGGGNDRPVSVAERNHYNLPRRVVVGATSDHNDTGDDNLTIYYDYE